MPIIIIVIPNVFLSAYHSVFYQDTVTSSVLFDDVFTAFSAYLRALVRSVCTSANHYGRLFDNNDFCDSLKYQEVTLFIHLLSMSLFYVVCHQIS